MSSFKTTGLDKLKKQLKQMEKGAKELSRTEQISFEKLFSSSFMRKYTSFTSIDELFDSSSFKIESKEDLEAIPDDEFDKHVANTTKFKNWEEMLGEATSQYVLKKLGL